MVLCAFSARRAESGWLRGWVWIFPIANPLAKTLLATLRAVSQRFSDSWRLRRDHSSMRAGEPERSGDSQPQAARRASAARQPTLLSATATFRVDLRDQVCRHGALLRLSLLYFSPLTSPPDFSPPSAPPNPTRNRNGERHPASPRPPQRGTGNREQGTGNAEQRPPKNHPR